jgi:hypothetical protein
MYCITQQNEIYGTESFLRDLQALRKKFPVSYKTRKVHYHVHKSLAPVPIQVHINPVHTLPYYFSNIHFSITLPI